LYINRLGNLRPAAVHCRGLEAIDQVEGDEKTNNQIVKFNTGVKMLYVVGQVCYGRFFSCDPPKMGGKA
jgi:hypothetical protein